LKKNCFEKGLEKKKEKTDNLPFGPAARSSFPQKPTSRHPLFFFFYPADTPASLVSLPSLPLPFFFSSVRPGRSAVAILAAPGCLPSPSYPPEPAN
jgi:hypothetical protein